MAHPWCVALVTLASSYPENRRSLEKRYGLAGGGRTVKTSKKAEGENRQGAVTPRVAWRRKTPQKLKTRGVPLARVSL